MPIRDDLTAATKTSMLARDADRATGLMAAHFEMTTHILLQADEEGADLTGGEARMLIDDAVAQN